jgi:hypothetical protein
MTSGTKSGIGNQRLKTGVNQDNVSKYSNYNAFGNYSAHRAERGFERH